MEARGGLLGRTQSVRDGRGVHRCVQAIRSRSQAKAHAPPLGQRAGMDQGRPFLLRASRPGVRPRFVLMVYRLERRLSHADVDFVGELKVAALLGLLEQAAVEASTEAGFDPAWYAREGRMWIIRRTRLERFRPVGGSDTLEVETHVADFRRARSLRRYHVRRDGVIVAEATTDWVFCDVTSGRPMRYSDAMKQEFT